MKKYRLLKILMLLISGAGSLYAQDKAATYSTDTGFKRISIDSISFLLNHIHLARSADPDSALRILYRVYYRSVAMGYMKGVGAASAEIGGTFLDKGEYDKAEQYILYSRLLPELNEYVTTNAINNLYLICEARGDYSRGLKYLERAMMSRDANVANVAYNNYITLLLKLKRYKEALYYIGILKEKATRLNQPRIVAASLCNEAATYAALKDYKRSDSLAEECAALCRSTGQEDIALYNDMNRASSYSARGRAVQAVRSFAAMENKVAGISPDYQMEYYSEYGMALYKAGNYAAAAASLEKAQAIAGRTGIRSKIEPVYYLAKAYQSLGDHRRAGDRLDQYIRLKDSLQDIEVQRDISEYEVKFRIGEKDKELLNKRLLILEQKAGLDRRNTIILLSVAGVLLLLVVLFAYYKYSRQHLVVLARDLDLAEQKAKANFLQAMVQGEEKERKRIGVALHNGVGSRLTAINLNLTAFLWKNKHLPLAGDLEQVVTQVQQTAVELRSTAHNLVPESIAEKGLYFTLGIFIQQFEQGPVQVTLSGSGDPDTVEALPALLIYRIIQELVHNALKHAGASAINIQVVLSGEKLAVTVSDNGAGFDPLAQESRGIGLAQIREQLALLGAALDIRTASGQGAAVSFEVDLKYSKTA